MAPEHLRDSNASKEGDVYSFAIISSEVITRREAWSIHDRKESVDGKQASFVEQHMCVSLWVFLLEVACKKRHMGQLIFVVREHLESSRQNFFRRIFTDEFSRTRRCDCKE